jgi:glycosyltransferase involved in cell wall biosynthesis
MTHKKLVSVVISARDEGHNTTHTVHSIINDLETFLSPDQFEIILVDNGSIDQQSWRFLMERGMFYHRTIRVLHDPLMGNVTARNKGARIAQGKYLFFSDAHMSYRIGSFKALIARLDEVGGMVHAAVQWMGGYEPSQPSYQYTIKIGEKLWGTWNNYVPVVGKPFYIPVSGHCLLGVFKDEFLENGGYNDYFRCYGGGELYLDLKYWMLGKPVSVVPEAVGYHLSAGRGYSYVQDDLIHNMMLLACALGAQALAERVYLRYLSKPGVSVAILSQMYEDARREAALDTSFVGKPFVSLYDTLTIRPWDVRNMEEHGNASSAMSVFDDTWTQNLAPEAKALFDASDLQRDLGERIARDWAHLVYKGSE